MSAQAAPLLVVESGLRRWLGGRLSLGKLGAILAWLFILVALAVGATVALLQQNLTATAFTVPVLGLFVAGTWYASLRTRLVIGRDGISMTETGKTCFVPWNDVDSEVPLAGFGGAPNILLLNRSDGRQQVPLHTGDSQAEVRNAVEEGLASYIRRKRGELPDELARGDADVERWSERLAQAAQGSSSAYRSAPLTPDQLVRVVEDPAFDPQTRIGAALAAARSGAEKHRVRVRVAASQSANDETRKALEAAADKKLDSRAAARAAALYRR